MSENNHSPQTFANHVRYHPIYHFFLLPAITINLGIAIWQATSAPGWASAQQMLVAVILVVVVLLVRTNPLRAQDRIIRLEEQLRFERVLSKEQAARARTLRVGQIVALRFASDAELPQLIESILAGRLSKSAEIKKSIRNWRGDHFRVLSSAARQSSIDVVKLRTRLSPFAKGSLIHEIRSRRFPRLEL